MAASVRSVMILRSITFLTTLAKPALYFEHFALLIDILLVLLTIISFPCRLAHRKFSNLKYVIS